MQNALRNRIGVDLGLLLIRMFIGVCLMIHGGGKFQKLEQFAGYLGTQLHMPLPMVAALLAATAEAGGGLLLVIGAFTRLAALPAAFTLFVGAYAVHGSHGYLITNEPPGFEYAMNLGVVVLAFALMGAGRFSIDGWRAMQRASVPVGPGAQAE